MNPKYQNGKIYKLVNKNTRQMLYIGSTIQTLFDRLLGHKMSIRQEKSSVYKEIKKYGIENIIIELIEDFPCNNRKELEKKEGYYIKENYDNIYNINIPQRNQFYIKKVYYTYTTKLLFLIIVIHKLTQHVYSILINIQSKNTINIILFIYKNFINYIIQYFCYIHTPCRFTQDDINELFLNI